MAEVLLLAFLFLVTGLIAVPLTARFGLGSILGYLLAGIALSPILKLLQVDVVQIRLFAEFGVVMLLFLVGLQTRPSALWAMRGRFVLGGVQVAVTTVIVTIVGMSLGLPWQTALICGFILSHASTAIVMQTLNERGWLRSDGGQMSFSVLLFQDVVVIPMIAVLPLLAAPDLVAAVASAPSADAGLSLVAGRPTWQAILIAVAAIALVGFAGAYLVRPVFRFVAMANLRELFVATALIFVIGISLVMTLVGLAPALGTFLAGVVLANSEFRHELESDINPFRGLLVGLFFMTVGAGINFALLAQDFPTILAATLGIIAIKMALVLALGRWAGAKGDDLWLFAVSVGPIGGFGFVLLSFATTNSIIPQNVGDLLLLMLALSTLLGPVFFAVLAFVRKRHAQQGDVDGEPDEIDAQGNIIIAGHGRLGGVVNRMLLSSGYTTTVLDHSASQLDMLRSFGVQAFYGDATRADLLEAAGISKARLIVVALDEKSATNSLVKRVKTHYPSVRIIARAVDREHVFELNSLGADHVVRETFSAAAETGRLAWQELGLSEAEAQRFTDTFVEDENQALQELSDLYDPEIPSAENEAYVARVAELLERREQKMKALLR